MPVVPSSSAPSTSTFIRMLPPNEALNPDPTKHTCTGLAAVVRVIDIPVMVAKLVVSATSPAVRWARAALVPPTSPDTAAHVASPRQKVEEEAEAPLLRLPTGRLPLTSVDDARLT